MSTASNVNHKDNPGIVTCRISRSGFRVHSKDSFSKEPGRLLMLAVNVQNFGDVVVLHCKGRIVAGETTLQEAIRSLKDPGTLVVWACCWICRLGRIPVVNNSSWRMSPTVLTVCSNLHSWIVCLKSARNVSCFVCCAGQRASVPDSTARLPRQIKD